MHYLFSPLKFLKVDLGFFNFVMIPLSDSCFLISFLVATDEKSKDCDCFALFLLTHGSDSGEIYGTDSRISVKRLLQPLKNNSLAGKPKMVFLQVFCSLVVKIQMGEVS